MRILSPVRDAKRYGRVAAAAIIPLRDWIILRMPYIEGPQDLQWFREKFGDVWQSATLTYSSVAVNGVQIPHGEIKFSHDPG